MTTSNIRTWAWGAIATIAIIFAALIAGGAVSFAQDSSETATPTPSASSSANDNSSATPAPSDDTESGDHNCPDKDTTDDSGTSATTTSLSSDA